MAKITELDDLQIYQESLALAQKTYRLVKDLRLQREFSLVDQAKRASLSIAANIAEGYGRNTKKDFSQFLSIALGSVNELVTFLHFISLEFDIDTKSLRDSYTLLRRRIYAFRTYLLSHNS